MGFTELKSKKVFTPDFLPHPNSVYALEVMADLNLVRRVISKYAGTTLPKGLLAI